SLHCGNLHQCHHIDSSSAHCRMLRLLLCLLLMPDQASNYCLAPPHRRDNISDRSVFCSRYLPSKGKTLRIASLRAGPIAPSLLRLATVKYGETCRPWRKVHRRIGTTSVLSPSGVRRWLRCSQCAVDTSFDLVLWRDRRKGQAE